MPVCPECRNTFNGINSLYMHLIIGHSIDRNSTFRCHEHACFRVFSSWPLYRKHLLLRHSATLTSESVADERSNPVDPNPCSTDQNPNAPMEDAGDPQEPDPKDSPSLHDIVLSFSTKYYANNQLPRSFVQGMMTDVTDLMASVICHLKQSISLILPDSLTDVCYEILDNSIIPFHDLSTEYRRLREIEKLGYSVPVEEYIIGDRIDDKCIAGTVVKETVPVKASFMSMRHPLKKLFTVPGVLTSVKNYMTKLLEEEELIENFVQGKLWRHKVLSHFNGKLVIPLFLYFDDFEINNPLGSHAGINKMGVLYYTSPCFPPEVSSQLDNIFLASIFHSADRLEFQNSRLFQKVIDEINFLQSEGISIDTKNGTEHIYFALGLILGDNLGLNSILGFVESFNANFYCRLCKTHKEVTQYDFKEKRLRMASYSQDVALRDVSLPGIKENCVWNEVHHFSADTNFCVDWLHDGPEGWFKFLMGLIVHHFVKGLQKENCVSLEVINSRINSFQYRINGLSNKPPCIGANEIARKELRMTGSEVQNFILIFSLLVGDLVPHDDVWKLYLLMRQIMDIILTRQLQKGYGNLLRALVEEHLHQFQQVFPQEKVKPKGHNLVHYATVLEQSGPIVNMSTIRFEAKHKNKKKEAFATSSRKNICKTLCIKEQLMFCHRLMQKKGLFPSQDYSRGECFESLSQCEEYASFCNSLPSDFHGPYLIFSWVKINGITYYFNSCVILKLEEEENLPCFGTIRHIIENEEENIYFVCETYSTNGFDSEYHAYDVCLTSRLQCVLFNNLHSPLPVIMFKTSSEKTLATVKFKL